MDSKLECVGPSDWIKGSDQGVRIKGSESLITGGKAAAPGSSIAARMPPEAHAARRTGLGHHHFFRRF